MNYFLVKTNKGNLKVSAASFVNAARLAESHFSVADLEILSLVEIL